MRATFRGAPLNQARSLGERCKLPQRGLERSPSQNRIWCNLAIKSATILMILLRIDQLISVPENISFQKIGVKYHVWPPGKFLTPSSSAPGVSSYSTLYWTKLLSLDPYPI